MIAWWWLIPAFGAGGLTGAAIFALWIADAIRALRIADRTPSWNP